MKAIAHIFASTGKSKSNSGDYMLGISTKRYFREKYLQDSECNFYSFDCRNKEIFREENINQLNKYDYIVVGGGGLILPDSAPNNISAWQWIIKAENYRLINKPIYVISIGYNLFYGQNINMSNRNSNRETKERYNIFKKNIETLIEQSEHFSLRHRDDIEKLMEIVDPKFHSKIKFEMCPTVWYCNNFWKRTLSTREYLAIEIKDDRPNRRYTNITRKYFYSILIEVVKTYLRDGRKVCFLSHDGSKSFYRFLADRGVKIPILDNSVADEKTIYDNYNRIHTLICMAGHSQMIGYSLGINIISIVTHPKVLSFCKDIGLNRYIDINNHDDI